MDVRAPGDRSRDNTGGWELEAEWTFSVKPSVLTGEQNSPELGYAVK